MKLGLLAFKNIRRNRKRSILSIIATGISTFAIVFMFAYMEGMEQDMKDLSFNYESGEVQIRHKEFDDKIFSLDRAVDDYKSLLIMMERDFPEFDYAPRLRFPSQVLDGEKSFTCFGLAVDFSYEKEFLNLEDKIISGRLPISPREVLIGVGLAEELGVELGGKFTPITLTRKGASSGITFTVAGMAKFTNAAFTNKTFIAPLDDVPMILRMEGAISELLIKGIENDEWTESADRIDLILYKEGFKELEAVPWTEVGLGYSMFQMMDVSYAIMAIFFFILSSTVIANTMLMVVFERRKEIGTLTAMGMTENEIVRLFFIEALILGVIGALLGEALGIMTVIPLSYTGIDLSAFAEDVDFGISWYIFPHLTLKSTLWVFIYSVFVASFISFLPSRGAAKVDPVVALRSI